MSHVTIPMTREKLAALDALVQKKNATKAKGAAAVSRESLLSELLDGALPKDKKDEEKGAGG